MTTTFKKISLAVFFTAMSVLSANAQETPKKEKAQKHQCTEACASGKHTYKHGEKGHKCDASCKTTEATKMELKDHVCTDACHSSGKCVKAHGEKGHKCDASCKKM